MKMWLLSILLPGLLLTANACGPAEEPGKTEEPTPVPDPEPNPDPQPGGKGRSLVVYFSCTNTTQGIAEQIAAVTSSGTHRIEPAVAYTSADLNYNNSSSRANREQNDLSARPAIGNTLEGLSDYDVVFLGYPIWWGKSSENHFDFSGKL